MDRWRLIESGFDSGPVNMALDEAISDAVTAGRQPPTLRLYGWKPPAISLGYHQDIDDGIDHDAARERGYDIVRRPTGGRAILHSTELTYSFSIRQDEIAGGQSVMKSYREISRGIIAGLALIGARVSLGPDQQRADEEDASTDAARAICFAKTARCDLQAAGRKVVGSAQVRRDGGILQHGSIPIEIDLEDQIAVMPGADDRTARRVLAGAAMSVNELLGRPVSYKELSEAVARGFADTFAVTLVPEALSDEEQAHAQMLHDTKYSSAEWNERAPARG